MHTVLDLGKLWGKRMELPLPIELNVISRRFFDSDARANLCDYLARKPRPSLKKHLAEATNWALRFQRESATTEPAGSALAVR